MRKSVIAALSVVVILFCGHYAISEAATETKTHAQQIEEEDRHSKINRILSGTTASVYPRDGFDFFGAMDCALELPEITEENEQEYIGTRYLIPGKFTGFPGGVGCFELEDGRTIHVELSLFILSPMKQIQFENMPEKNRNIYLLCTFSHWSKYAEGNSNLVFIASVLQDVQDYVIDKYGEK